VEILNGGGGGKKNHSYFNLGRRPGKLGMVRITLLMHCRGCYRPGGRPTLIPQPAEGIASGCAERHSIHFRANKDSAGERLRANRKADTPPPQIRLLNPIRQNKTTPPKTVARSARGGAWIGVADHPSRVRPSSYTAISPRGPIPRPRAGTAYDKYGPRFGLEDQTIPDFAHGEGKTFPSNNF